MYSHLEDEFDDEEVVPKVRSYATSTDAWLGPIHRGAPIQTNPETDIGEFAAVKAKLRIKYWNMGRGYYEWMEQREHEKPPKTYGLPPFRRPISRMYRFANDIPSQEDMESYSDAVWDPKEREYLERLMHDLRHFVPTYFYAIFPFEPVVPDIPFTDRGFKTAEEWLKVRMDTTSVLREALYCKFVYWWLYAQDENSPARKLLTNCMETGKKVLDFGYGLLTGCFSLGRTLRRRQVYKKYGHLSVEDLYYDATFLDHYFPDDDEPPKDLEEARERRKPIKVSLPPWKIDNAAWLRFIEWWDLADDYHEAVIWKNAMDERDIREGNYWWPKRYELYPFYDKKIKEAEKEYSVQDLREHFRNHRPRYVGAMIHCGIMSVLVAAGVLKYAYAPKKFPVALYTYGQLRYSHTTGWYRPAVDRTFKIPALIARSPLIIPAIGLCFYAEYMLGWLSFNPMTNFYQEKVLLFHQKVLNDLFAPENIPDLRQMPTRKQTRASLVWPHTEMYDPSLFYLEPMHSMRLKYDAGDYIYPNHYRPLYKPKFFVEAKFTRTYRNKKRRYPVTEFDKEEFERVDYYEDTDTEEPEGVEWKEEYLHPEVSLYDLTWKEIPPLRKKLPPPRRDF